MYVRDKLFPTPPVSPKISLPSIPRSSNTPSIISTKSTITKGESKHSYTSSETLTPSDADSICLNSLFPTPPNSSICSLPSVPRSSFSSNNEFDLERVGWPSLQQDIGSQLTQRSRQESSVLDILDSVRIHEIIHGNQISSDKPSWIIKLQDCINSNNALIKINPELPLLNQLQNAALSDSISIMSLPSPPNSPKISLPSVPRSPSLSSTQSSIYNAWNRNNKPQINVTPLRFISSNPTDLKFNDNINPVLDKRRMDMNHNRQQVETFIPKTHNILQPTDSIPSSYTLPASQRSDANIIPSEECILKDRCCCFKCCRCCIQ